MKTKILIITSSILFLSISSYGADKIIEEIYDRMVLEEKERIEKNNIREIISFGPHVGYETISFNNGEVIMRPKIVPGGIYAGWRRTDYPVTLVVEGFLIPATYRINEPYMIGWGDPTVYYSELNRLGVNIGIRKYVKILNYIKPFISAGGTILQLRTNGEEYLQGLGFYAGGGIEIFAGKKFSISYEFKYGYADMNKYSYNDSNLEILNPQRAIIISHSACIKFISDKKLDAEEVVKQRIQKKAEQYYPASK